MNAYCARLTLLSIGVAANFVAAANVDVTEWALSTTVVDFTAGPSGIDHASSHTVANPFLHTQSVSLGPTDWAEGGYDIGWLSNTGSFHLGVDQHLHGIRKGAGSGGQFYFTTDIDLIFNAAGSLTFASSPGDEASFSYSLNIRPVDQFMSIFTDGGRGGDRHFETPASGSLAFNSDAILLAAGVDYRVNIHLGSDTSSMPNQDPISAHGEINFSWRPVPEPGTLLLVLPLAGVLLRRRR